MRGLLIGFSRDRRITKGQPPKNVPSDNVSSVTTDLKKGNEQILVVEDDPLVREYVISQLTSLGYEVLSAADGKQAMQILESEQTIDLLLTDVVLPEGMNGRKIAEQALKLRPGLRVLYTSGYTENSIVHHGRLDPGVLLLSKPYSREELANKVRMALDVSPA